MSLDHALKHRARIAANILSCYSNADTLTTPLVKVEDFQKSYTEETHSIFTEEQVVKYGQSQLKKSQSLSKEERVDFIEKSVSEIKSFDQIRVIAENGANRLFFVRKKDLIEKGKKPFDHQKAARGIVDDIASERKGFESELRNMSDKDIADTVSAYGHTGENHAKVHQAVKDELFNRYGS